MSEPIKPLHVSTAAPTSEVSIKLLQQEDKSYERLAELFDKASGSTSTKLANFPLYVRNLDFIKFLSRYELMKQISEVKGSIIECGVMRGFGLMSWYQLAAIMEPTNVFRRIIGFDTFEGFPSLSPHDHTDPKIGWLAADSEAELLELLEAHDRNQVLGHVERIKFTEKVRLVRGNATETIPQYLKAYPETIVSLLYLDFDLYEPTKVAIEHFLPRMPRGAIVCFDELDHHRWPGETQALIETVGIDKLEIRRLPFDPYISYAILK